MRLEEKTGASEEAADRAGRAEEDYTTKISVLMGPKGDLYAAIQGEKRRLRLIRRPYSRPHLAALVQCQEAQRANPATQWSGLQCIQASRWAAVAW